MVLAAPVKIMAVINSVMNDVDYSPINYNILTL